MADLTIGLFLVLARTILLADRSVKEGKWPRLAGDHLNGKVLGIIGLGKIGRWQNSSGKPISSPFTSSLNPATRGLVGEKELSLMKKDALLVNVSCGGIVDEEALHRAVEEGRIRGAALDVFAQEPPAGSPLLKLHNLICRVRTGAVPGQIPGPFPAPPHRNCS